MKTLITGGAGYQGSRLTRTLLEKGYVVAIIDDFNHGFESVLDFFPNKNFSAAKKDIRDVNKKDLAGFDVVYHLAGLTGYDYCEKNPFEAKSINIDATKNLCKLLSKDQLLVFASTTSFYGNSGKVLDENSKVSPTSIYAKTKYEGEKIVMWRQNSVSMRFASLFGISIKMRNDLMIHDFIYRAINDRFLVLYNSRNVRTFLHIDDAIPAYLLTLNHLKEMRGNIFNVGTNKLNFSKLDLANKIKEYIDFEVIDNTKLQEKEKRDYFIKYDKIKKIGFKSEVAINDGIKELVKFYSLYGT